MLVICMSQKENIVDELLYHSRPLALSYLALTEDASVPVTRCKDYIHYRLGLNVRSDN